MIQLSILHQFIGNEEFLRAKAYIFTIFQFYTSSLEIFVVLLVMGMTEVFQFYTSSLEIECFWPFFFLYFLLSILHQFIGNFLLPMKIGIMMLSFNSTLVHWKWRGRLSKLLCSITFNSTLVHWKSVQLQEKIFTLFNFQFYTSSLEISSMIANRS